MTSVATIAGGFLLCPPLDLPLRLRNEWGAVGYSPFPDPSSVGHLPTDHFAAINHSGEPEMHRIHEAIDLESGSGNVVYAVYTGEVVEVDPNYLILSHQVDGTGYASQYVHAQPIPPPAGPSKGDIVLKGQPIATVKDVPGAGAHLHFELWHWTGSEVGTPTDRWAVSIDPTRSLYRWEEIHALDYAVLGAIPATTSSVLDVGAWNGGIQHAYRAGRLPGFQSPTVEVIASGAVWRISDGDRRHLLRLEEPSITVFDEAYGTRTVALERIDRLGIEQRRNYPALLVSGGEPPETYAVPLHDPSPVDEHRAALLRLAYEIDAPVELQVRRSAYWSMDGSVDEVTGVVQGVNLLR